MIRFEWLETLGVVAGMSDCGDGDCALLGGPECRDNRVRVAQACGLDGAALVGIRQVHGSHVAVVDAGHAGTGLLRADAIADTDGVATGAPGVVLTITVADCVPLFLVDPVGRRIALVHAGRVGTELNIGGEGLRVLEAMGTAVLDVHAYVGPSAGPCCYEVDVAMAEALRGKGMAVAGRCVDLWESNARQLAAGGVPRERIYIDGRCTVCDGAFHSHRATADGRRNMAFLALR